MDLVEGLWSGLPFELVERVLSFVPVLDLCRLRSVCKRWNGLICKESFHDLCEQSRKENPYFFVTRHYDHDFEPAATSFLDLDSRRWYSLKPHAQPFRAARPREKASRFLTMDDGLMCDMTITDGANVALTISDPVARTTKELPESPVLLYLDDPLPIIVTAVDSVSRSYRVFVITNDDEQDGRVFMYESCTSEWSALKNPPEHLGVGAAVSAVSLGGMLYVVFRLFPQGKFLLMGYSLEDDAWKVFSLKIPNKKRRPQLVVSCNRLFMMMWISEPCLLAPMQQSSQRKFHLLFEVREVLVAESSSRMMAQLSTTQLQQMFDEEDADFDIAYGVPCFNSRGFCKSLILMSFLSGKLISYDLSSGLAVALPACPAHATSPPDFYDDYPYHLLYYQGKYTNLSLRSLSSPLLG